MKLNLFSIQFTKPKKNHYHDTELNQGKFLYFRECENYREQTKVLGNSCISEKLVFVS